MGSNRRESDMGQYNILVGERLRKIRQQKGMSLHDVEQESQREFKASVLGAYERGERSISVPRLQGLARFYGAPVDHLLPKDADDAEETTAGAIPNKIRIDLQKLDETQAPEKPTLKRYLDAVQMQRGDFNGKVLTIRNSDLQVIASVLDLSAETLFGKIEQLGIRAGALN